MSDTRHTASASLTLKTQFGEVCFESDRDGDVMICFEDQERSPRTYLNRDECQQLAEFLAKWLTPPTDEVKP